LGLLELGVLELGLVELGGSLVELVELGLDGRLELVELGDVELGDVELGVDVLGRGRGRLRPLGLVRSADAAAIEPAEACPAATLETRTAMLILTLAAAAAAAIAATFPGLATTVAAEPARAATILGLTLALQMSSVRVYGRGSVSVSAIGVLTGAFLLDVGTAMAIAVIAALAQTVRTRPELYKSAFDLSNYAISAGAAWLVFHAVGGTHLVAAVLAGTVYAAINNGTLCLAMSLSEHIPVRTIWRERFHWARYHFALFGPLAFAATIAYEQIGVTGLVAFALPSALMILSVRQYLERTTEAVEEIRRANLRLRRAHRDTIAALSRSMEAKDLYTGGHTERVAAVAVALARELGFRNEELEAVEIGALLHDIGKIGVPEQILRKQGPLDESEWDVIKSHPVISDYILSELDLDPIVRQCARSSHERIDGKGYPDALAGDDIPLPARIVLVADALDALTSTRTYRPARAPLAALAEIRANAGTQFCPRVVAALERLLKTSQTLLVSGKEPNATKPKARRRAA
jgi:putative nucleotidyltransferase with HDIG domain